MSAATQSDAGWQIERLAGSLGAEIHGVDLAAPSADDIERIKALLVEHQVLFFPDQSLTPDQHVALGPHFGRMEGHPHLGNADGHPELFELRASGGGIADEWLAHRPHIPARTGGDVDPAHGPVPARRRRHHVDLADGGLRCAVGADEGSV